MQPCIYRNVEVEQDMEQKICDKEKGILKKGDGEKSRNCWIAVAKPTVREEKLF
jgi:hypothetical protein